MIMPLASLNHLKWTSRSAVFRTSTFVVRGGGCDLSSITDQNALTEASKFEFVEYLILSPKMKEAGLSSGPMRTKSFTSAAPRTTPFHTHRTPRFCTVDVVRIPNFLAPNSHQNW